VPLRHPVAQRRRHQKHLLSITPDEPRTHAHRLPTPPDELPDSVPGRRRPPLRNDNRGAIFRSASGRSSSTGPGRVARSRRRLPCELEPASRLPLTTSGRCGDACVRRVRERYGRA
jgi:hypothetical protein